ncbi:cytochrome c biogenesis protein/redoxin [Clostridium weizhouense]|uniref:Redoxin domain-containing protein n=1 Tax=Clostridium weizhouense TaxID=2859781 RepID=A0ABS7ALX3_9CLOT|nr:cytochrome c biogenesis protein/redoxin [Clostridium weizhouense]MBW6409078.1 redoxin domain-containing protein [Clostridium weizhouense]
MFEGLVSSSNISFFLVFLEGILSFLSPCVLPLIPIYIGYLAGNSKQENNDGTIVYKREKVLLHTIFFVLGISTAFFILGLSFTAIGTFFNNNRVIFSKIGGVIIILLGLFQIGIFKFKFLQREHKINLNLSGKKVNPLMAYLMGFTFSFAWTPCVGPALSSVLILASSAQSTIIGNILVLIYSLGFVIPFLILGIFTTQALNFINKNKKIMKYTIKAGGFVMIIIGIMTFTGWLNNITGYLNRVSESGNNVVSSQNKDTIEEEYQSEQEKNINDNSSNNSSNNKELMEAIDFTLTDQYGNTHKLSDYKGKTVFLNFWATWCPPCRMEMPHIEELYKESNYNKDDIIIIGVSQPGGNEQDKNGIKNFLNEQKFTFPVVFDESGEIFNAYHINSLPTTFMINKEGKIYGYVSGALSKEQMKSIIDQTQQNN